MSDYCEETIQAWCLGANVLKGEYLGDHRHIS